MIEQSQNPLGVKLGVLVAGFFGGLLSMSYARPMGRFGWLTSVSAGVATSTYMTPIVFINLHHVLDQWVSIPPETEFGVAFFLGLCGFNIIPGFVAISESWRRNPVLNKSGDKP